jgi:hypothetical protein
MAKSILKIIQSVARELNIPVPQIVMTNGDADIQRLLAFTIASCDDLADEADWTSLQRNYSFTTVPGQILYPKPLDFLRVIKKTAWTSRNRRPLNGSTSPSNWSVLLNGYGINSTTKYRLIGNQIEVFPVPTAPETINFEYISIAYIYDGSIPGYKQEFTFDSDQPAFHARCLTNFVILKWFETGGFPTQASLTNFNESLKSAKAADKPGNAINMLGGVGEPLLSVENMPDNAP